MLSLLADILTAHKETEYVLPFLKRLNMSENKSQCSIIGSMNHLLNILAPLPLCVNLYPDRNPKCRYHQVVTMWLPPRLTNWGASVLT